ncbi:MAG: SMC-Scp complex subunit ScpB [FCB group bacterium]|nr:SMC-Scp complex subunit ScpB [FCB group bacterium]
MIREENINCTIEALILSSNEPVSIKKICEVLDSVSPARVRQAIGDLNNVYLGCGSSFRIRELAGGYQMYILADFESVIKQLLTKQRTIRLSGPALETLAIIAFKQPVTKIDIEHIRGVASDGVIHNLLQRKLIVISGRTNAPGRPLLYKTSNEFLKFFGLNRLSDLPNMEEIEEMIKQAETPKEQTSLPLSESDESLLEETLGVEDEIEAGSADLPEPQVEILITDGGNGSEPNAEDAADSSETQVSSPEVERSEQTVANRLPAALFEDYDPIPDEPPPVFFVERPPITEVDEPDETKEDLIVSPPLELEASPEPVGVKLPTGTFEDFDPLPGDLTLPSFKTTPAKSVENKPTEKEEEATAADAGDN